MEAVVDANTPVDYIEFHIVPSQNRYEACVCYENKNEKVTSGLLEHLLLHSVDIKALHLKGSDDKYKLYPPENLDDSIWFTKSTLIRFLHIIGSSNILEVANSLKNEISQLEEARRFHLSLYAKAEDSDASKNELLRAMDLRLNALREELTTAFDQAAGSRYSVEEMTDIAKFSRHLGSTDLSDSLGKHIELIRGAQTVQNSSITHFSESDGLKPKERSNHTIKSVCSELPVIYGVSPAKAAQLERQYSTGSDESSFSSEDEQPSAERSRTLIRSASPRRSASPMRRIQIGRSGSRRSTAISIKSLNYIPCRDRMSLPKDSAANDSDEESTQVPKKPENNGRRMSVQDAINLFERKQRDQTVDTQKAKSLLSASIGANKSVLRRWSSGMGEDSSQCPQDDVTEIQNNVESKEVTYSSQESEAEQVVASEDFPFEPCESDVKLNSPEKEACTPVVMQDETRPTESTDVSGRVITSAEWSRQKEAELNELLIKMMETKPVKSRTSVAAGSKRQSLPSEQRSGFYDHYKEKRDEKLQGEAAKKREGKDKQLRGMQQVLDAKKSQPSPANGDGGKKHNVKKLQKPQISASQPANPKAESPRLGVVKKASTKASSMPATRKSWPSMPSPGARGPSPGARGPSPGARGPSPAKTPAASSGAMPTRRKSQQTPPASQVSSKVETSQIRAKSIKPNQNESKKILKPATEKKQQSVTSKKTAKSKVQTATEENLVSSAKPNLYNKVTKKSSVVPLESKPFLRKGSGNTSGVNLTTVKKKASPQEPLMKSDDLTLADDNLTVSKSTDLVVQHEERENKEFETLTSMESETSTRSPQQYKDKEDLGEVNPTTPDGADRVQEPELKAGTEAEEESTISPTAWVEIEEQDHSMTCGEDSNQMVASPAYKAPVGASSPRVRHSLSQMLLEESSEPDSIDWGIAENPPAMVYHKDAPKGFKRLLKFARKSKNEANSSGWSSPAVFSEGEDDSEDSRYASKRSSENLLRIATHHSKNNGHQKNFSDYEHHAQANVRKLDAQSLSQQFQEGNVSASVTTTKATRSFFSLSAFKGGK